MATVLFLPSGLVTFINPDQSVVLSEYMRSRKKEYHKTQNRKTFRGDAKTGKVGASLLLLFLFYSASVLGSLQSMVRCKQELAVIGHNNRVEICVLLYSEKTAVVPQTF